MNATRAFQGVLREDLAAHVDLIHHRGEAAELHCDSIASARHPISHERQGTEHEAPHVTEIHMAGAQRVQVSEDFLHGAADLGAGPTWTWRCKPEHWH